MLMKVLPVATGAVGPRRHGGCGLVVRQFRA